MDEWLKAHPMGTILGDPLPGAPALAARGDTVVGVRTIRLTHPGQADVFSGLRDGRYPRYDRPLAAEVWYPALAGGERAVYTDYLGRADLNNLSPYAIPGRAWRDARPDPQAGPRPVVVISHGYPGSRILLVNLAENLASKGYVVLSIGHTDNTYEDFAARGSLESALIHHSLDQRFVIGELPRLNGEGFLKGLLMPENVGLVGFSMGGYGALRTIGVGMKDPEGTPFAALAEELAEPEGYAGVKAVKAAVLFAPALFWLEKTRAEDVDIPTLWFCGSSDRTVFYQEVHRFSRFVQRSDRVFVSYERCGHNVANNPAPVEAQAASCEIYKRWADPVWDTWKLNNLNAHFTTAFLDSVLRGDEEAGRYLDVPVPEGHSATWPNQRLPAEAAKPWPGFADNGAAGVILERFPKK